MNYTIFNAQQVTVCAALFIFSVICTEPMAQNKSNIEQTSVPLNLDDKNIAEEFSKEIPSKNTSEKISVEPNQLDAGFAKAKKHGIIPTTSEIQVTGAPQRVTKVTGADGSYCVYSPTVARTDGIDEIQNGLQNQVRTCPP